MENHAMSAAEAPARADSPHSVKTDSAQSAAAIHGSAIHLDDPGLYLNRELTWLAFNQRVLHEAQDPRTPLLERVKFLAIVSNNLDEFFMKRIGGLKQQLGANMQKPTVDGRTPKQQIDACYAVIHKMQFDMQTLLNELVVQLRKHDIYIIRDYEELSNEQKKYLQRYYYENIFPLVTPQGMDPAHPFPFLSNYSLNILVSSGETNGPSSFLARVKVPVGSGIPRFIKVEGENIFVPLEEVMVANMELLLPGMEVQCAYFRITRNASTERSEENADDLLAMIESELRDRRIAPIVRMEVQKGMDNSHKGMLGAEQGLVGDEDIFEIDGLLALKDLFQIAALNIPELHDAPHQSVDHPKLQDSPSIFHTLRDKKNILVHHPYESFSTSVERFLREASLDPKVRAIKMTLYRTSSDTKVIDHLITAARNGKQVAVVVELKARFDEAANIQWASRMEEAGIHVTYGVVGLKTHSKVILVVRQDYNFNKIQRYAHIGTGNYHAGTAKLYCDLGLLTCDNEIGEDLTELFNYLTTGHKPNRNYKKILPSPKILKKALLEKINREILLHNAGTPGLIQFKMNALEDKDVAKALYRASQAGVQVDLIIRDTCRVRPGIPGVSEKMRVISIVGRFLEHSRIYYFRNGGNEEYFIGSADSMQRNLESRVEVVTAVTDEALRGELRMVLDTQFNDQRRAWEMRTDGSYVQRQPKDSNELGCQETLIAFYQNRANDASRDLRRWMKARKRNKRNGWNAE